MIIGKSKVIDWIRYNKTPYWKIKRTESEPHMLTYSGDEENIPLEESVVRLNNAFNFMAPGNYFIESWETKGQTKNWKRDHFQILPENQDYVGNASLQQMIAQQQPAVNVQEEIDKALAKYRTDVELQDLRRKCAELERENKELQSGIENSMTKIYNRVEPYLGMLLNIKDPAAVAVGSVTAGEAQARLEKAFDLWQQTESDPVTMIEKIAHLSKTDPATYSMAKNFLTGK